MYSSIRDRLALRIPCRPKHSLESSMKYTDFDMFREGFCKYDKLLARQKKGLLRGAESFVEKAVEYLKARDEAQLAAAMKTKLIADPRMSVYFGELPWEMYAMTRILNADANRKQAPKCSKKRQPTPKPAPKPVAKPMKIYDPTPKSLAKLPVEIQCLIFSYIDDECTSACLGLTCRSLYAIHHENYPITDPFARCFEYGKVDIRLYELLSGLMGIKWCLKLAKDVGYLEFEESVTGMKTEVVRRRAELPARRC